MSAHTPADSGAVSQADAGLAVLDSAGLLAAIDAIQASSVRMAEIVRVIGEIASQTNLLQRHRRVHEIANAAERQPQAADTVASLIEALTRGVSPPGSP